jgi:ketosteroid isomerase-like protein
MSAILRLLRTLFLASFTFAGGCIVAAQTNPFTGTSKFVPERSHFEGTTPKDIKVRFLIDKDELREGEELTRSNGSTRTAVFIPRYDGMEHPFTMSGETKHKSHAALWNRPDDRTIERRIDHDNGLEYTTERLSVSPDGETLTETHFGKRPDATSYETVIVLQRDSKTPSVSLSPAEKEVWAQEEVYWRSLKADDRETYLRLWDERFVGWPRFEAAPAGKEKIRQDYAPGTTVRAKLVDYKLEPLSVRAYGNDMVIAFYRAILRRERNGQAETSRSRLTHTWMRTDHGWQIVGGMSADDNQPAVSAQSNRKTPESSGYEAELRTFMAGLRKASLEGDVDAIANSMTDDYVQTDINGYRQDKTTWLNEYFKPLADLIEAGKFRWDEYERTNLRFRFYGDCAVVTGELHAKGTGTKFGGQHTWVADPNASFSGTLHFTHVYIKRNGKWMLAALHNQMSMPPANAAK